MMMLLDALALAAVLAAVAYLWRRRRRPGCGAGADQPAETRVPLDVLRASARRAGRRR